MKFVLSSLPLIASLGLSYADPTDRPPVQTTSFTIDYPAMRAFHHNVGATAYIGYYYNSKPSNCSVLIWAQPDKETSAEKVMHHKVRIDLSEKQSITFFADELGSNLNLECAADGKSLSIRQTSVSLTQ